MFIISKYTKKLGYSISKCKGHDQVLLSPFSLVLSLENLSLETGLPDMSIAVRYVVAESQPCRIHPWYTKLSLICPSNKLPECLSLLVGRKQAKDYSQMAGIVKNRLLPAVAELYREGYQGWSMLRAL